MDYTAIPLAEKLRKVARYTRLYGIAPTLQKVRAQAHMKFAGTALDATWSNPHAARGGPRDVAIIGCGGFAYSTIAYHCARAQHGFLRACYDTVGSRAVSLCTRYRGQYAARDPREIVDDPATRLVFIASNHASHAEFAIQCLAAGKSVHIEKPHVVSDEQLTRLIAAMRASKGRVYLGFNRPSSPHFRKIQGWLATETGPLMINWFIAGHEIPDGHWYFSDAEGGRVLGNLCHWTDLTLRLADPAGRRPVRVVPGTMQASKSDFALNFDFGDGSVAAITFSAKGSTFEGVREYLNVHRGNALVSMRDFQVSTLDRGSKKETFRTRHREHGHAANIRNSLLGGDPVPVETVVNSAKLFLAARRAVEEKIPIEVPLLEMRGSRQ